jgi:hypothetical protein
VSSYADNPAGRLLSLLEQVLNIKTNMSALRSFRHILGIHDQVEAALSIASLLQLPDQAAARVAELPPELVDSNLFLEWHEPVKQALLKAFFSNLDLNGFVQLLDQKHLVSLRFCSDLLHRNCPDPKITDVQVQRIATMVHEIWTELKAATGMDSEC